MTVGELLGRISSREMAEWMVYYGLEPFGEERADLRAGIVASTVANTARDPKRQHEPFKPQDFMPKFEDTERKQRTAQELYRMFRNWAMGARPAPDPLSLTPNPSPTRGEGKDGGT